MIAKTASTAGRARRTRVRTVGIAPETQLRIYETMVMARRLSERLLQLQRAGVIPLAVPCDGHEAAQVGSALALPQEPAARIVYPYYRSLAAVLAYGMTPLDILLSGLRQGERPEHRRAADAGALQPPRSEHRHDLQRDRHARSRTRSARPTPRSCAGPARWRSPISARARPGGRFPRGAELRRRSTSCRSSSSARTTATRSRSRSRSRWRCRNVADRASAYNMPGVIVDGNDVEAVYRATQEAVRRALAGDGPTLIEAKTYRLAPHTSDDDDRGYRPPEEIAVWRASATRSPASAPSLRSAGC